MKSCIECDACKSDGHPDHVSYEHACEQFLQNIWAIHTHPRRPLKVIELFIRLHLGLRHECCSFYTTPSAKNVLYVSSHFRQQNLGLLSAWDGLGACNSTCCYNIHTDMSCKLSCGGRPTIMLAGLSEPRQKTNSHNSWWGACCHW